jgi:hypothetical protein
MEGMTTEQMAALVKIAELLPIGLVFIAVLTRHWPLLGTFAILWVVAYFLDSLPVPGWPHLKLINTGPDYIAYWTAVAIAVSFILRARKSAFAMMRALVAPVVFADYFLFMTSGIYVGYLTGNGPVFGWLNAVFYSHMYYFLDGMVNIVLAQTSSTFLWTVVATANRYKILAGLVVVPVFGLVLYAFIVWWYLPYLQQYPEIKLPRYLPVGFISDLKTVRIRALTGFVEEHTKLVNTLRSYGRTRAK